ncbi:MAG: SagB/ThcOx family dehydrogenase, partial [Rhodospirillales bacterium]
MGSNEANLEAVRAYHQGTKHGPHGFAPGPGFMDWANQPDPFRRYAGADLLPLPLQAGPADLDFAALDAAGSIAPSGLDAESLSLFLELSMGLTAWKAYQDTSWALRANPSSGNLHPTELTLVAPAIEGVSEQPGIYHYAPRDHGLERLQAPSTASLAALIGNGTSFLAILSSVHWRESWKYGERA